MKTWISLASILSFGFGGFLLLARQTRADEPGVASPAPLATVFRFEPIDGKSLGLWEGKRPIFVYNHGALSKATIPSARSRSSYLHPVFGLDEEVLTDDFPKDHDYHRGLYWAWPHIKIGNDEFDSWSLRGIRTEFQRWLARETTPTRALLGVENAWLVGERKVMEERVRILVHPASPTGRALDVELTWTPTDRPITLWGAEGKSYGGLNVRFGPRRQTIITVPTGRTSEDLVVTRLPWADFSGDFRPSGELSGAAIFVAPEHPDYPPTWMTRHYGFLAVGWPGVTAQTLPAGQPLTCRYRIWIHRGCPDAAVIQSAYDSYLGSRQAAGAGGP